MLVKFKLRRGKNVEMTPNKCLFGGHKRFFLYLPIQTFYVKPIFSKPMTCICLPDL